MEKYLKQLQLHFPNAYGNGNFISNLRRNIMVMMNPKDNSSGLAPVKAHAFEVSPFQERIGLNL